MIQSCVSLKVCLRMWKGCYVSPCDKQRGLTEPSVNNETAGFLFDGFEAVISTKDGNYFSKSYFWPPHSNIFSPTTLWLSVRLPSRLCSPEERGSVDELVWAFTLKAQSSELRGSLVDMFCTSGQNYSLSYSSLLVKVGGGWMQTEKNTCRHTKHWQLHLSVTISEGWSIYYNILIRQTCCLFLVLNAALQ